MKKLNVPSLSQGFAGIFFIDDPPSHWRRYCWFTGYPRTCSTMYYWWHNYAAGHWFVEPLVNLRVECGASSLADDHVLQTRTAAGQPAGFCLTEAQPAGFCLTEAQPAATLTYPVPTQSFKIAAETSKS